jgi:hypothetical protein
MSPAPTPQSKHMSRGSDSLASPIPPSGRMTEPRNYAPRTSGTPVLNEPPPKFDLSLVPYQGSASGVVTPEEYQDRVGNLVLQTLPEAGGLVPYNTAQNVSTLRSEQLNTLTGSSELPSLRAALDPAKFPFIESAKQCKNDNYGVVKLGNVSDAYFNTVLLLIDTCTDSLRYETIGGHCLSRTKLKNTQRC